MDAACELREFGVRVAPSQVHYWAKASEPRAETKDQIARWSKGAVPSDAKARARKAKAPAKRTPRRTRAAKAA